MNTKDKIIEAQRRILDSLVECETQVGQLYEMYAGRFQDCQKLWNDLAAQEKVHANLLKTMYRILEKGNVFYNLGKFDISIIEPIFKLVREAQAKAGDAALTPAMAISNALAIETSMLDSHFYDVVTSDAPEFSIIAARLSTDTKKHVEHIRTAYHTCLGQAKS